MINLNAEPKSILKWHIVNGNFYKYHKGIGTLHFFHVSRLISIMTGKLSQHTAVSYIPRKDLKLTLIRCHIFCYFQFAQIADARKGFTCNL